jgi:serine/threonine protein kinase
VDENAKVAFQDQRYRIFDFRGKLKVIAVPFIEGSHVPQSKEQLLGVAKFLKKMHDSEFVHGDIRLLNIVFTKKPEDSQLIDFDFGGKGDDDSLVYPPGYKRPLEDGLRIGEGEERILKWHDVYALFFAFDKVLFNPGLEWLELKVDVCDYTIEELITVLEGLVKEESCQVKFSSVLRILLERNTTKVETSPRNS